MAFTQDVKPNGGWNSFSDISAAAVMLDSIATKAGKMGGFIFGNSDTVAAYVRLYDKATSPTPGTDTPLKRIVVPAGGNVSYGGNGFEGVSFNNGLWLYASKGASDSDNTALSSTKLFVNVDYVTSPS